MEAQYLKPTVFMDYDHPLLEQAAKQVAGHLTDPREIAVALYKWVRDDFPYDPYQLDLSEKGLKASTLIEKGRGYCVEKANLLATSCRFFGIPARLGFADVINHLS